MSTWILCPLLSAIVQQYSLAEKDCTTSLLLDPTNVKVLLNRSMARKVGVSNLNIHELPVLFVSVFLGMTMHSRI